jgi:hypothetical protein
VTKKFPATQYSPDRSLALVPRHNPDGNIWWTLHVRSPKSQDYVAVQGGTTAYWMIDLGFNPYATE